MQRALERFPHSRGGALLKDAVAAASGGAESTLEARYLHEVERAHGLPAADRQFRTRRSVRSDAAYRPYLVLVELDGRQGHEDRWRQRDNRRDALSAAQGWVTLRFTWADVISDPCLVAETVASTLRTRGWDGSGQRCQRCMLAA